MTDAREVGDEERAEHYAIAEWMQKNLNETERRVANTSYLAGLREGRRLENEACAKIVDTRPPGNKCPWCDTAALAIRSRSAQKEEGMSEKEPKQWWIDDVEGRVCGPWSELPQLGWPNYDYVDHAIEFDAYAAVQAECAEKDAQLAKDSERIERWKEAADEDAKALAEKDAEIKRLRSALNRVKEDVTLIAQDKCPYEHMKGGACKDRLHCLMGSAANIVLVTESALSPPRQPGGEGVKDV